jgi:predicted small secreted protein
MESLQTILLSPGIHALFSAAAIAWICNVGIAILAVSLVTRGIFKPFNREIESVVGLVGLSLLTVHMMTGSWIFF